MQGRNSRKVFLLFSSSPVPCSIEILSRLRTKARLRVTSTTCIYTLAAVKLECTVYSLYFYLLKLMNVLYYSEGEYRKHITEASK